MDKGSESCPFAGDCGACGQSLIDARRGGRLNQHCIFAGLAADRSQCRRILLKGLYNDGSDNASQWADALRPDLDHACKEIIALAYPRTNAAKEVFFEAFHRLILSNIVKGFHLTEQTLPSVDDMLQEVCKNLHEHFSKGARINKSLAHYVSAVTVYTCFKKIKEYRRKPSALHKGARAERPLSHQLVPPYVVEEWEACEHSLRRLGRDDADRIIIAHLCINGWSAKNSHATKTIITQWKKLAQMNPDEVRRLCAQVWRSTDGCSQVCWPRLAADSINAGILAPYQTAIALAVASHMDCDQTLGMLEKLARLSTSQSAITTRINRLRELLVKCTG